MKTETQMATCAKQIHLTRRSPNYWRVTIDHPPLNVFGPETIPQLNEVITSLETDEDVKVVVFDSAVEGFFLTHYDFLAKLEDQLVYHLDRQGCNHCPTCWYGLVVSRWCRLHQSGDARLLSEVSWLLPVTCVSRVAKKLSFRSSKSGLASCPA